MDLIKRLEAHRLKNRITQERLAEMLGVSFATVNRWFNGKTRPRKIQEYHIKELLGMNGRRPAFNAAAKRVVK
jgi:transcriptional regulator with XRE-family HTH domain